MNTAWTHPHVGRPTKWAPRAPGSMIITKPITTEIISLPDLIFEPHLMAISNTADSPMFIFGYLIQDTLRLVNFCSSLTAYK